jgi:hypothetical protein
MNISGTDVQPPTVDSTSQISLLKDEVDALAIKVASQKSPWYRQASTLISVVALALSTLGGLFSWLQQRNKDFATDTTYSLTTLQQMTSGLVDTQKTMLDNPQNSNWLLNSKRALLAAQAEQLATRLTKEGLGKKISPTIFYTLAQNEYNDGEYTRAESLYINSINAGGGTVSQTMARWGLAHVYFTPDTSLYAPNKGREQFGLALKYSEHKNDDFSHNGRAILYTYWGEDEWLNNNYDLGINAFAKATSEYSHMSPANSTRRAGLDQVRKSKVATFRYTTGASIFASAIVGLWNSRSTEGDEEKTLTVTRDATTGELGGELSPGFLRQSGIKSSASGAIQLEDTQTALLDWTGSMNEFISIPITGRMVLHVSQDGKTMNAQVAMVNSPTVNILLHKTL